MRLLLEDNDGNVTEVAEITEEQMQGDAQALMDLVEQAWGVARDMMMDYIQFQSNLGEYLGEEEN